MSQTDPAATDHEAPTPLLRVIDELRSIVAERVDELRSQILALGRDPLGDPSPHDAASVMAQAPPSFLAPGEALAVTAESDSRLPKVTTAATPPRDTPSSQRLGPTPGPATAPPGATGSVPASEPPAAPSAARSDDPRQRLEALARLLDRKVKPTGAPGAGGPA